MEQSPLAKDVLVIQEFIASKQVALFQNLKESQFTGELYFWDNQQHHWIFYLYLGRICYATGGPHPLRRLRRQIVTYFPSLSTQNFLNFNAQGQESNICPEYEKLSLAWQKNLIERQQLAAMIKAQITEILFDLTQAKVITYKLLPRKISPEYIIPMAAEAVIADAWKLWQSWQAAFIADRSPNLAPIISKPEQLQSRTSPKTYQAFSQLLTGHQSLREISLILGQDVVQVTRILLPYLQLGLLELIEIPDFNFNLIASQNFSNLGNLISCISYNTSRNQKIGKILKNAGYQYLSIQNLFLAVSIILEYKPRLLLVDSELLVGAEENAFRKLTQKQQLIAIPIILIKDDHLTLPEFWQAYQFADTIKAPIEPESFLRILEKCLNSQRTNFGTIK